MLSINDHHNRTKIVPMDMIIRMGWDDEINLVIMMLDLLLFNGKYGDT